MGISRRKVLSRVTAAAALASLAQGCAWFNISNPFLPSARLIAVPAPTQIDVNMSFSAQSQTVTVTPPNGFKIHVQSYQNDGTPGVTFTGYSAEYFDLAGKPIPSVLLSKANFGVSAYIPPASAAKGSAIDLDLPVYNQQVKIYGVNEAYSFAGGATLNPNFSHTINARVTLYGEDDNYNQVQYSLNVPIRFNAEITQ